jgi:hypothetical protein
MKKLFLAALLSGTVAALAAKDWFLQFTDSQPAPLVTGYGIHQLVGTNWVQIGGVSTSTNAQKEFKLGPLLPGTLYTFGVSATNATWPSALATISTNLPAQPGVPLAGGLTSTGSITYTITGTIAVGP